MGHRLRGLGSLVDAGAARGRLRRRGRGRRWRGCPHRPAKGDASPDLAVLECFPAGPFTTVPCSRAVETIYAQVAANGPYDGVRVRTVGVADCANPREWPAATPRTSEWWQMVRFEKGGTDYGGFVGTGGKLGVICAPFTSE